MSHIIGKQRSLYGIDGYDYRIEINGLAMTGWRAGPRGQVEAYVRDADRLSTERSGGRANRFKKNGKICMSHMIGARNSNRGRAIKKKPTTGGAP